MYPIQQTPITAPINNTPTPPNSSETIPVEPSKNSYAKYFVILIFVVLISTGAYFFLVRSATPHVAPATPSTEIKTTDLAPGVPNDQKTVVLVQHSDSSQEKFVVQTTLVDGYIETLPEGDKVVSQNPAQ